jgi:hypothetical protein
MYTSQICACVYNSIEGPYPSHHPNLEKQDLH